MPGENEYTVNWFDDMGELAFSRYGLAAVLLADVTGGGELVDSVLGITEEATGSLADWATR